MKRRFWEEDDQIFGGHLYSNLPFGEFSYPSNGYFSQEGRAARPLRERAGRRPVDQPVKGARRARADAREQGASADPPEFESAYAVWWKKVKYSQGGYATGAPPRAARSSSKVDNRIVIGSAAAAPVLGARLAGRRRRRRLAGGEDAPRAGDEELTASWNLNWKYVGNAEIRRTDSLQIDCDLALGTPLDTPRLSLQFLLSLLTSDFFYEFPHAICRITGWGDGLPPSILDATTTSLTFLDTSDEWITSRTGMKERRISHVSAIEMATLARVALWHAPGLDPGDVDLIVYGGCSNEEVVSNSASPLKKFSVPLRLRGVTPIRRASIKPASVRSQRGEHRRVFVWRPDGDAQLVVQSWLVEIHGQHSARVQPFIERPAAMPAPGAAARTKLPRLGMTEKPPAVSSPVDSPLRSPRTRRPTGSRASRHDRRVPP